MMCEGNWVAMAAVLQYQIEQVFKVDFSFQAGLKTDTWS